MSEKDSELALWKLAKNKILGRKKRGLDGKSN
jgi:hypothetical protein